MLGYRFHHSTEVRYGDLDPQGHLNNAKYLTYFEQARIHYWMEVGLFSQDQSFMEIGVIVADIHIRYLAPVHWGAALKVGVSTERIGTKSITMNQALVDQDGPGVYSDAGVVLVAYDYASHKSIPVPDAWRDRLERFEGRTLGG